MTSTVTPFDDMAPSPRVLIDIDDTDLHVDTVTAIVMQLSKWGDVPVNRTPRAVAGGLVLTDYEVPPGVPVTYRVHQFDVNGDSLGFALSMQTQVDVPFGWVVVQDPLAPADAIMLEGGTEFAGVMRRVRPSRTYQAGGKSFALSGLNSAFLSVPLQCFTDSPADQDLLARILDQSLILVRAHPRTGIPGSLFAAVTNVAWDSRGHARFGRDTRAWDFTTDEVSRPSIDIIVPIYTYDLYKAYLDEKYPPVATYDDAATEWATFIDAVRNPPPVV